MLKSKQVIMKIFLSITVLFVLFSCNSQSDKSNITIEQYDSHTVENLAVLCKVWGFLKYYHPSVADGEYNWDRELFRVMPQVINSQSTADRNKIFEKWIKSLGEIKTCEGETNFNPENVKIYPDLDWIRDGSELDAGTTKLLSDIVKTERSDSCQYVGFVQFEGIGRGNPIFKNEDAYPNMSYTDTGMRLLALFRYWNIIQYYFPYRYLIEDDWHDVLVEFIPQFIEAKNELEYKLALLRLISRVSDTHANIWGDAALDEYRGLRCAPFEITFIENKAVVTDYYKPININCNIQKGDIILSIDNISTDSIINKELPYTSASNYPTKLRSIAFNLLRTNNEKLLIKYKRDSDTLSDLIFCPFIKDMITTSKMKKDRNVYEVINDNIGYLYLGSSKGGSVPSQIETKGLIIDLRCYPNSEKVKGYWDYFYLYPAPIAYSKFSYGSTENPGLFSYSKVDSVGKENPNYYKGKKVILINELSQSHAEFMAMKYRCAPNTIVIGSTTAGADGNVSKFALPGGINTQITGVGIYYPDGSETQRIGIIPNIEVKPTVKGVREGRDEVLEKAIELINKG